MRFVALLALIFLPIVGISQNSVVVGEVLLHDNSPAFAAIVSVKNTSFKAQTDLDGKFQFASIPNGNYQLEINMVGTAKKIVQLKANQPKVNIKIVLDAPKTEVLSEVQIEHKTPKRKLEEQGYAVSVIHTKDIQLQNIQTNELLDRTAGVRIRQTGGLGSNVEYNINGLSGNSIRILIDGIPISNYGPSFSLNSIPPSLIDRIEIFKGVVPPHLADDALGGAINIVLKKSMHNQLSASFSAGSFNTYQGQFNGNFRDDRTGFTVNASGFYNQTDNNYEVWGDKVYVTNPTNGTIIRGNRYKRFHDAYTSFGGKFEAGYTNVKWADQFSIGGMFSDMEKENQHGATMQIVYGNRFSTQNTRMTTMSYRKRDLLKGLDVNALATYSRLNRQVVDTIADMYSWNGQIIGQWASGGEQGNRTLQMSIEDNFSGRANAFYRLNTKNTLGLSYLFNSFKRDQDDPFLAQAERDFQNTRFLKKHFIGLSYENKAFDDRLKSTVFFKWYHQNIKTTDIRRTGVGSGNTLNVNYIDQGRDEQGYGFAISYELFPKFLVVASGERAIRLPESSEVFGNNAENIVANSRLKPEQSLNANLGINIGPIDLFESKHQVEFAFNVFMRDTKDMIRQGVPSAVSETFAFENLNAVISKGFDTELKYNYDKKFFLVANASLFDSKFNTKYDLQGNPFFYYGSRLRNVPYFTANANARYDWKNFIQKKSLLNLHYNIGFVNEFLRDWEGIGGANLDYVPEQLVHDAGITYMFPNRKISISFDAKNIFDQQVFDNWALQKPGRAFYGKINFHLF